MTIAVDPILSNIVYTINLVMHLRAPASSSPFENAINDVPEAELPKVSVLLPAFKEGRDSILTTTKCLAAQTYPKRKLEALFIVEPDDPKTRRNVEEATKLLKEQGVATRILATDGGLKMKPYALNWGLKEAEGEIVCVYDADDRFEEKQVEMATNLMVEKGYDVVQPKVGRGRRGLMGSYLMLDTFSWNRKFLPAFYRMAGVYPLSGEGLFIRRKALDEVGGFPEVLTEDAYLSILLAEKGKKFGLLDSRLEELAPRGVGANFRQRLRWFRGYLTCLGRTLKSEMALKKKLTLLISFLAPITCAFSLVTWTFLAGYWLTWAFLPSLSYTAPWMLHPIYPGGILYWSGFLAYIGNPIVMFSLMHSIAGTDMERHAPLAITAPLYWIFIGAAALASFFKSSRYWGKTVR